MKGIITTRHILQWRTQDARTKNAKLQNSELSISLSANPNSACCRRLTIRETCRLCWTTRKGSAREAPLPADTGPELTRKQTDPWSAQEPSHWKAAEEQGKHIRLESIDFRSTCTPEANAIKRFPAQFYCPMIPRMTPPCLLPSPRWFISRIPDDHKESFERKQQICENNLPVERKN